MATDDEDGGVVLPNFTSIPADYPWFVNFDFEKNFDHAAKIGWFQRYWSSAFVFSAVYLVLIFGGQRFMKNRPRFELRLPLTLWSLTLAIYSWYCVFRSWGEFLHILRTYGWHATACDPICFTSISGFWAWTFSLSKLAELSDTAFIVLRKQKLIFLHWYHHITVLIYAWYSFGQCVAPGRYFVGVNCNVHAVMYSYYAAKAAKLFRIPRYVNIFITAFQTTQMFVGIMVNYYALRVLNAGGECSTNYRNIGVSFLMYLSYFILFLHFFYKAYFVRRDLKDNKCMDNTDDKGSSAANGHVAITNGNGHVRDKKEIKKDL